MKNYLPATFTKRDSAEAQISGPNNFPYAITTFTNKRGLGSEKTAITLRPDRDITSSLHYNYTLI